jgi:glycosyltransferase involved in cell wall biosynthesis
MPAPPADLVYVAPIAPAPTGNGLAMRSSLFITAAQHDFNIKVLVVPVAGEAGGCGGPPVTVLPLPDRGQILPAVAEMLSVPRWRQRISAAYPLPGPARLAPAALAAAAISALRPAPGAAVHVARSYLAPLGLAIAERLGSPWATLDLDDDDEQLARSLGDRAGADAYGRLIGVFGPLFQAVALAAPSEAAAVSHRHGFATTVLPNAVALVAGRPAASPPAGARQEGSDAAISVLFTGNLTYRPNAEAAISLVEDILPLLRRRAARPVTVTLAGDPGPAGAVRSLGSRPGVRVTGYAADLGPYYRAADVLVAPLAAGSGTRIKLLEALAHGLPVVTTAIGAAGLDVTSGVHLLIADSAAGLAGAAVRVTAESALRERLTAAGRRLVISRYSHDAVIPQIRAFLAAAAPGSPPGARYQVGTGMHR